MKRNYKQILPEISSLLLDVDGVLTDGHVYFTEDGKARRKLFTKDSFAIQLAIKNGLRIGIITGGSASGLVEAFKALGMVDIYVNASDKLDAFQDFVSIYELNPKTIAYMGDDLPDYSVMQRVGLAACPADASPYIRERVNYISPQNGGAGAVRDFIEQWLRVKGFLDKPGDWTW
ncbi:MAG: HAD hydrolase family protein [Cryomorphaceae bacterium]|nr:HAD hydrolase family protein [Cryomorphaceae bacterium]